MMVALLNKIASFHAMWTSQTASPSPAETDTPSSQNEFKGIPTDAFFFARTHAEPQFKPSHPDGSNCGAGCGSS